MSHGDDVAIVPQERGKGVWTALWTGTHASHSRPPHARLDPQLHWACLMRAVSSCTRLYTERSSRMSLEILSLAWITVV